MCVRGTSPKAVCYRAAGVFSLDPVPRDAAEAVFVPSAVKLSPGGSEPLSVPPDMVIIEDSGKLDRR
jgi:hypothetical protein